MRVNIFLYLFCYFLDDIFVFVYSKSCGLPPECNIRCYVLDVSMPKHTMHCTTPDLVTVLALVVYFRSVSVVVLLTG